MIARHADKILTKPGQDPSKPKILLMGPTGMAASLIGNIYLEFNIVSFMHL